MALDLEPITLSAADVPNVQRFRSALSSPKTLSFLSSGGKKIPIPPAIYELLTRLVGELADGQALSVVHVEQELTSQKAAELIGVSRQFLVRLLDGEKIPFHWAGTHRRVYLRDLLEYKRKRDEKRVAALDRLAEEVEQAGVAERIYIPQDEK